MAAQHEGGATPDAAPPLTAALTQDGGAHASGVLFASSQDGGRKARVEGGAGAAPPVPKMAAVAMRLPVSRKAAAPSGPRGGEKHLVAPGDTITTDTGYMRWGPRR